MFITDEKRKQIFKRKAHLLRVQEQLKEEFIGIDNVIDDVVNSFEPWYIFPEYITKPIIVNLWGMTGTGKSSLVRRLVEIVNMKNDFVNLDVGEFIEENTYSMKRLFFQSLEGLSKQPCIIAFDEFQFANSFNENHQENRSSGTRAIWEILDTGKITNYDRYSCEYEEIEEILQTLQQCRHSGIKIQECKVMNKKDEYRQLLSFFVFRESDNSKPDTETDLYVISNDEANKLYQHVSDKFETRLAFMAYLNSLTISGLIDFIKGILNIIRQPKVLDFSKSIIFVIGNLDEAYLFGDDLDPDSDPDLFFELSKRINSTSIKSALQKRFRNEQIARLGNNHIIYPAFSREMYRNLIELELSKSARKFKWNFEITLEFSDSVRELIYFESVFPTQGARPVITSVNLLIESYFSKIINDIFQNLWNVETICWDFISDKFQLKCIDKAKNEFLLEYPVTLKVDSKRRICGNDKEALVAVHECGHAIVSALVSRILPKSISCVSANSEIGGRVEKDVSAEIILTSKLIKEEIMSFFGRILAEELIFGSHNVTAGAESDIYNATRLANSYLKDYGMGSILGTINVPSPKTNDSIFWKAEHQNEIESLLNDCKESAKSHLQMNRTLLVEMARELALKGTMNTREMLEFFNKYSVEDWVRSEGFIMKETYYKYRDILFGQ